MRQGKSQAARRHRAGKRTPPPSMSANVLAFRRVAPLQTNVRHESRVDELRPTVRRDGDEIDSEPLRRISAVGHYVAGSTGVGKTFIA
jgi:hypothetical protein